MLRLLVKPRPRTLASTSSFSAFSSASTNSHPKASFHYPTGSCPNCNTAFEAPPDHSHDKPGVTGWIDAHHCSSCTALQFPAPIDPSLGGPFGLFGLPLTFSIDLKSLENDFRAAQRLLHPDVASQRPSALAVAEALSAQVNVAYRTLRDPLKRAQALLSVHGSDVAEEEGTFSDPEFLMEVLEAREALEEALSQPSGESRSAALTKFKAQVDGDLKELEGQFSTAWDSGDIDGSRAIVMRMIYSNRLEEEIKEALYHD